jgi:hypothetical protein
MHSKGNKVKIAAIVELTLVIDISLRATLRVRTTVSYQCVPPTIIFSEVLLLHCIVCRKHLWTGIWVRKWYTGIEIIPFGNSSSLHLGSNCGCGHYAWLEWCSKLCCFKSKWFEAYVRLLKWLLYKYLSFITIMYDAGLISDRPIKIHLYKISNPEHPLNSGIEVYPCLKILFTSNKIFLSYFKSTNC